MRPQRVFDIRATSADATDTTVPATNDATDTRQRITHGSSPRHTPSNVAAHAVSNATTAPQRGPDPASGPWSDIQYLMQRTLALSPTATRLLQQPSCPLSRLGHLRAAATKSPQAESSPPPRVACCSAPPGRPRPIS